MNDPNDRYDGLPSTWSESACEVYIQVDDAKAKLNAAQRAPQQPAPDAEQRRWPTTGEGPPLATSAACG